MYIVFSPASPSGVSPTRFWKSLQTIACTDSIKEFSNIYNIITDFLKNSDPSKLNKSKLKNILNILLEKNNLPHNDLFRAFNFTYKKEIISNIEKLGSSFLKKETSQIFLNDEIIITALKMKCVNLARNTSYAGRSVSKTRSR